MTALAERDRRDQPRPGLPRRGRPGGVVDAAVEALRGGPQPVRAAARRPRAARGGRRAPARAATGSSSTRTEVQVTFGATEAIAAALLALVEPGDEVVVLEPAYDSYAAVVALAGGVRGPVALRAARLARSTPTRCAPPITPRTRVLLLNSPHNPTGRVLRPAASWRRSPRSASSTTSIVRHRRGLRAPGLRRRARPARDAAREWPSAR